MSSCNVINEYTNFSYKSYKKLLKLIMEDKFSIKLYDELFDTYKKIRYYDALEHSKKSFIDNIDHHLYEKVVSIKDSEIKENFVDLLALFICIYVVDDIKKTGIPQLTKEIVAYRKKNLSLESDTFEKEFVSLIEEIDSKKKSYFSQFESNTFKAGYFLTNIKKVYNVVLDYDIAIPKLYSEFAINKVYTTGVINEDRLFVEYYLVASRLLNEIVNCNFSNYYNVEFTVSLFEKKDKLLRLLNIIDSDIAKDRISLKINYSDYISSKDLILDLINKGYNFTLVLDDTYSNSAQEKKFIISLFKYIMIGVNSDNYKHFEGEEKIIKIK